MQGSLQEGEQDPRLLAEGALPPGKEAPPPGLSEWLVHNSLPLVLLSCTSSPPMCFHSPSFEKSSKPQKS